MGDVQAQQGTAKNWAQPPVGENAKQPLTIALAQYPILEALVSHLRPDHLVTFTTVAQVIHGQIRMHERGPKANLLSKTLCPGIGLDVRDTIHCPCRTKLWNKFAGCAGDGYDASSRPCAECGINTCDECRVHVTYQVYMDEDGPDNHRWWAGYALLHPVPFTIYPPKEGDTKDWHLSPSATKSHHDQGRVHVPLQIHAIADPEPLDRILDLNLGSRNITPCGRTEEPFDGHNLVGLFDMLIMNRKELMCPPCFQGHKAIGFAPCSCTFRKRFLDRWLCIPCYLKERTVEHQRRVQAVVQTEPGHIHALSCRCGAIITIDDDFMDICTWCNGEVNCEDESESDLAEDTNEHIENAHSTEDESDDNLAPAPTEQLPQHMYSAYNKDGTLSIFFEHKRIMGEPLGHAIILQEARRQGKDLPCTCCMCPISDHGCGHGHTTTMGEVEDEMEDMDLMEPEGMEAGSDGEISDLGRGTDFDKDDALETFVEDDTDSKDEVEPDLSED